MNHSLLPSGQCKTALVIILSAVSASTGASPATACPFCSASAQTLSEEIQSANVAVLATMIPTGKNSGRPADDVTATGEVSETIGGNQNPQPYANPDTGMVTFQITHTILGAETLGDLQQLQVVYFGDYQPNKSFLISGITSSALGASRLAAATSKNNTDSGKQRLDWSTPLPLSPAAAKYVKRLTALPAEGANRLLYFMKYLEHKDPLLAQDSYDEFARAPYEQILELGDQMDRSQLVAWINDPQVGPTRRRLYLTMLGVCGQAQDVEMLESLLQYNYRQIKPGVAAMVSFAGLAGSALGVPIVDELVKAESRRKKQCLDALVACYLKLKGPDGLPLIEQQFLDNPATEYTHVYATIMALRFHGEETDVIPKQRLIQSLRLVLNNPEIADQVIPDLTRWEDWEIMDRLVTMFKTSDSDGWIRQPVISYLVVASEQTGQVGTRAQQALTELEQLDPKTVERARSLMVFSGFGRATSARSDTTDKIAESTDGADKIAESTDKSKVQENPTGQNSQSANLPSTDGQSTDTPNSEKPITSQTVDSELMTRESQEAILETQGATLETQGAALDSQGAALDSAVPTDKARPTDGGTTPVPPASQDSQVPKESQPDKDSSSTIAKSTPKGETTKPPSRLTMIGVPLMAGLVLMGIFAVLLRGSDFRETE